MRSTGDGRSWLLSVVAVTSFCACGLLVDDYHVAPEGEKPAADAGFLEPTIGTQEHCSLDATFAFEVSEDPTEAEDGLESYYQRENPAILRHLEDVTQEFLEGSTHVGVTYLMGAAGVGKSFLTRNAFDGFPETERCAVDLKRLLSQDQADALGTRMVPDLATIDGAVIFGELPGVESPGQLELGELLVAADCVSDGGSLRPLIVLDGLDELQEETSRALLRKVDEFQQEERAQGAAFRHFVIAGRPGGFAGWLTDPSRTEVNNESLQSFLLQPPRYASTADIAFRVRGYLDFAMELSSWEADDRLEEYFGSVAHAMREFPFLSYTLGNLALGNVVIDLTRPPAALKEEALKGTLFDSLLERNHSTHGRPGPDSPLLATYLRLLQDAAAMYSEVDPDGGFAVLGQDRLVAESDEGEELGEVSVRSLFNRAGLLVLPTPGARSPRYRFEPFWLHPYLIELHNARVAPGYSAAGCVAP